MRNGRHDRLTTTFVHKFVTHTYKTPPRNRDEKKTLHPILKKKHFAIFYCWHILYIVIYPFFVFAHIVIGTAVSVQYVPCRNQALCLADIWLTWWSKRVRRVVGGMGAPYFLFVRWLNFRRDISLFNSENLFPSRLAVSWQSHDQLFWILLISVNSKMAGLVVGDEIVPRLDQNFSFWPRATRIIQRAYFEKTLFTKNFAIPNLNTLSRSAKAERDAFCTDNSQYLCIADKRPSTKTRKSGSNSFFKNDPPTQKFSYFLFISTQVHFHSTFNNLKRTQMTNGVHLSGRVVYLF